MTASVLKLLAFLCLDLLFNQSRKSRIRHHALFSEHHAINTMSLPISEGMQYKTACVCQATTQSLVLAPLIFLI